MKYIYCIPFGGFGDQLATINKAIKYCKKYNRILIIDTQKSKYNVNYEEYFGFQYENVILDKNKIDLLICNSELTIYPDIFDGKRRELIDNKINFTYSRPAYNYNNVILDLPKSDIGENIIVYANCGGKCYTLFKSLIVKPNIKQILHDRYNTLKKPYLSIQIRNTDIKCNYELLYQKNKELIQYVSQIHIATDDINALDFFVKKGLPIKNFTTFPSTKEYKNLHYSNIDPHTKFVDMLSDIYICGMSDKLLSSSNGGFIKLIRNCNKKRFELAKQFDIVIEPDNTPVDNIPDDNIPVDNIPSDNIPSDNTPVVKIQDELVKIQDALDNTK